MRFEAHHGIRYSAAALSSAVDLSVRFITDRHLPDKAIDVIDEAGAAQRILPKSRQKKVIGRQDIEEIVVRIARVPSTQVSADDHNASCLVLGLVGRNGSGGGVGVLLLLLILLLPVLLILLAAGAIA